jgi:hypothetical protein
MDKAEQLIIHKQKEEKAKLDDIVDYMISLIMVGFHNFKDEIHV